MADRSIILAENGRTSTRGVKQLAEALFLAYQRDDDALKYTVDFTNWLSGGTISTVTRTLVGTVASSTSATTLTTTQKLRGQGYLDLKVLDSNGNTKTVRICIENRTEDATWPQHYQP